MDKKGKKYLGWSFFVYGCLVLLNSLILLNFLIIWTPSWFIALTLVGVGAWLLRLKVRGVFGIVFGLLALAGIIYCVLNATMVGIFGIIIFAILALVLLSKGLFRE